jgi:hypothetical protein
MSASAFQVWAGLRDSDRLLLMEAAMRLVHARLIIAILPFRYVGRLASKDRASAPPPVERAALIRQVRWAVQACARRAPFRALCLERGLAAQIMLRQRGVNSVLFYGVARDIDGLVAHVWVKDGQAPVIGCEEEGRYSELARFPGNA